MCVHYKGHFPLYIGDSVKLQIEVIYSRLGVGAFLCQNVQNQAKIREKSTSRRQDLVLGVSHLFTTFIWKQGPAVAASGGHKYPPTHQPRNQRTELHSSWRVRGTLKRRKQKKGPTFYIENLSKSLTKQCTKDVWGRL